MGRGTSYWTIYHSGGTTHILAYSYEDALEQFRKIIRTTTSKK